MSNVTKLNVNVSSLNDSNSTLIYGDDASGGLNRCQNEENQTNQFIMPMSHQALFYALFLPMCLVAVGGNLITIWIVLAHKRMRTVTNYFLVNLAVADTCISGFTVMFNFVYMLHGDWPFGGIYCKYSLFISVATITASVFTFLAIAVDRYVAIVHVLKPRMRGITAWSVIVGIWVFAIAVALPRMIYAKTIKHVYCDGSSRTICFVFWPDGPFNRWHMVYTLMAMFVNYLLPLIVIGVTYTRIGVELWGSKAIGENTYRQGESVRSKKKVVKMLIVVVFLFAICWLPQHLYFVITTVKPSITVQQHSQYIYLVIYWIAMSNSMYNPFIYCWMNSRFREGFKFVFRWLPCVKPTPKGKTVGGISGKTPGRSISVTETTRCERNGSTLHHDHGGYAEDALLSEEKSTANSRKNPAVATRPLSRQHAIQKEYIPFLAEKAQSVETTCADIDTEL
ncbi:tachykinin-like peptides receptor 99D [Tubulanus polymorphus]|uniref:tachykinin-like peptides receptor 99D n=1 Tax=Tubulanus polymorphus TaxID=672921 RepID=UPI003DA6360B